MAGNTTTPRTRVYPSDPDGSSRCSTAREPCTVSDSHQSSQKESQTSSPPIPSSTAALVRALNRQDSPITGFNEEGFLSGYSGPSP